MGTLLPYLIIQAPDGTQERLELTKDCYRFGRSPDPDPEDGQCNDVILADPVISGHHFMVQQEGDRWILSDRKSRNGTLLQCGEEDFQEISDTPVPLSSGDIIHVHGWIITFHQPRPGTQEIPLTFVYSYSKKVLYKVRGLMPRVPVTSLRPKAALMLRYMAQKNLASQASVCCTYEELIKHIWQDENVHLNSEVNGLAKEIRACFNEAIEEEKIAFTLLITDRKQGYRLNITCEP